MQLGLKRPLSLPEIAQEVGVSPRTIGQWFETFRARGVNGLLTRKARGTGSASWLDPQTEAELKAELDKGHWRRAKEAQAWLEERLQRKLSVVVT